MIKMTLEVNPEQAVKIAELLSERSVTTAATPTVQTDAPVQTMPIQPSQPQAIPSVVPLMPTVPVQQAAPTAPAEPTAVPPTSTKKYTMDELSLASRPIVEAGRQAELISFLHSFTYTDSNGVVKNVQSIRDLPEERYPEFAVGIRQMGGRI